ncbi:Testis-expressed sequence 10 protein [Armadillidium nasatum]|uniref:Testis-expressed sequence 10 protein n=1 Tax=Armadillidium nasatum TaxID=96803 RepID=A0A5N5TM01_9CRUS|nr:Testis-expressed sequence 10 protein [Armadillidium nasatum]
MTKSVKHKRNRKKDLNKIKLKLGKKLKKGQNETKTDFKARKIIMKEQLSAKIQSSLITKKNLNVNELLSRLSHASVYVRQDGLDGLKELVAKNNKFELGPYLSVLFKGLNPCILDTDHLIRSSAVRVLEALIVKIGAMVQPYFQLVASHLSCAMVHLNTGVQADSLQLMDVLLSHATSLIAQNANTILKNFFMLISRKIDAPSNSKNPFVTYTLISNPSSRLATLKWRIKLIRSLSRYLEAILGECGKLETSVPVSFWQVIIQGSFPSLVTKEVSRTAIHGTKILTEETESKSFIENLLPLLFQSLAEVKENKTRKEENIPGTPLDGIAIELLKYISEILVHMWKIIEIVTEKNPNECEWFMGMLKNHLEDGILDGFPYAALKSSESSTKEQKPKIKINIEMECHSLNITLSSLLFLYKNDNSEMKNKVFKYYNTLFSDPKTIPLQKLDTLASTVSLLFHKNAGLDTQMLSKLLNTSLHCFKNIEDKSKYSLLKIPLKASDIHCKNLWRSQGFRCWVKEVVAEATRNPNEKSVYELMLQFKLRNTPYFTYFVSKKKDILKVVVNSLE